MKKRLLSLLLVACMLLSMVPVFSTVAVAAENSAEEETPYDYSKLYVQNGLKLLYTAYAGHSTVDLANNKWVDASGNGNDATFVNAAASSTGPAINWEANRNGKNGVGYDMLGGTWDGVTNSTPDKSANYNLGSSVYLNLPVAVMKAMNDGNYTLEYTVEYPSIHWYNSEGVLQTEAPYATGALATTLSDILGTMRAIYQRGDTTQTLTYVRCARWFQAGGTTGWGSAPSTYLVSSMHSEQGRANDGIYTQTVSRIWNTEIITFPTYILTKEDGTEITEYALNYLQGYNADATLDTTGATKYYVVNNGGKYEIYAEGGSTAIYNNLYTDVDFFAPLASIVSTAESPVYFTVSAGEQTTRSVVYAVGNSGGKKENSQVYYENNLYARPTNVNNSSIYAKCQRPYYIKDASATVFQMFIKTPVTAYSIRLYDRALEDYEAKQNHFADVCAFYKLDVAAFLTYSEDVQRMAHEAFLQYDMNEADYDATKASLQIYLDLVGASSLYDYSELYHKEGLVALYTSFMADNNVDFTTGAWTNGVSDGAAARISNPSKWVRNAFGATGFHLEAVTGGLGANTIFMELPYEYITGDNYTIDTFVNLRRHVKADGTFLGNTSTYNVTFNTYSYVFRLDSFNLMGPVAVDAQWRVMYSNYTIDGGLNGGMTDPLGNSLNIYSGTSPAEVRTYYFAPTSAGSKYASDAKFELVHNSLTGPQFVGGFAITKTTADGKSTFAMYNQAASKTFATYNVADMEKAKGATVTYTDAEGNEQTVNKATGITLSNSYIFADNPAFIYAVRIYNDQLSENEKTQNYFADVAAFYGLDMSKFAKLSENAQKNVIKTVGAEFMALTLQNDDLTAYTEERKAAQAILDKALTAFVLNEYDLLYVGADGSKTVNGGKLTMFLSAMAGNNNADLASGNWYDRVGGYNATFKNATNVTWVSRGESGVGYDLYGGTWNGSAWDTTGTNLQNGAQLTLDVNAMKDLNDSAYTFESIVAFPSVQWTDENGQLQTTNYTNSVYGWVVSDSDAIGNLYTIYQRSDSTGTLGVVRRTRWYLGNGKGNWNNSGGIGDNRYGCFCDSAARNNGGAIYNQNIERRWLSDLTFDTYVFKDAEGNELASAGKTQLDQRHVSGAAVLDTTGATKYMALKVSGSYEIYAVAEDSTKTLLYNNLFDTVYTWLAPLLTTDEANPLYFTVSAGTDVTKQATYYINGAGYGRNFYTNERYAYTSSAQSTAFATYSNMPVYPSDSVAKEFFMFKNAPCSVYSIRLYDAVLVAIEKAQNHFADVASYFALELDGFHTLSAEEKSRVYTAFAAIELDKATAAEAQTLLDAFTLNAYDMLYVGMDGNETANGGKLTMFLSALAGNSSADLINGKWYDKTGNYDATFTSTANVAWVSRGENGVGYDMLGGTIKEDGSFDTSANYTILENARLTLDVAALKALNDGAYTLDYIADFRSVQWYDLDGVLQTTNHANANMAGYTTYSEWIGTLKNIYQRSDIKSDLHPRQVRWFLAPGDTLWGSGQYYFNAQLHGETSRQGGGIQAHEIIRVKETVTMETWIFTYEDGSTVEIGQNKLKVFGGAYTFLTDGTKYVVTAGTKKINDTLNHDVYNIALEDGTVVSTNLYSGYTDLFGTLKEGTVTVTEGETETDKYTLTMTKDGSQYKEGIYYTNEKVMTTTQLSRADYAHNGLDGYVSDSTSTNFIMFNRTPCAVYSVRLYDADLTASEKAQNHFADLCAYYLVDIAGFADASADAKAAAYAAVAGLSMLAEDDADYVATKAKVQAAVDNATTVAFEAGATLPAVVEGVADRVVAVWVTADGETKYLPGTVLADAATLTPVLVAKGETVDGASVSVANGGLRFKTTFSASDYYTLGKVMGNENAVLSMIIAPELLIENVANGVFTKEALGADNYVEVAINGYFDLEGDTYTFAAGLSELSAVTKANDLSFAAVLCLTVKVGEETYEIYGDYNADCNRSGLDVLTPYIEDVIAGEETVADDLKDDLYNLYTGFAAHDTALAASLKTALGIQ
ncbi:MAG: hypothetical protein IJY71_07835 [Clostridia bacterium]|nr:hypothetical protein [Clostridia bacterium]